MDSFVEETIAHDALALALVICSVLFFCLVLSFLLLFSFPCITSHSIIITSLLYPFHFQFLLATPPALVNDEGWVMTPSLPDRGYLSWGERGRGACSITHLPTHSFASLTHSVAVKRDLNARPLLSVVSCRQTVARLAAFFHLLPLSIRTEARDWAGRQGTARK